MPDQVNLGYDFTINRFFTELSSEIDAAPGHIRDAYYRMKRPPEFELYDLKSDPHEFRNLTAVPGRQAVLAKLKKQLATWRAESNDPLLDERNLYRLKAEIDACVEDGVPQKSNLNLNYPVYFFSNSE